MIQVKSLKTGIKFKDTPIGKIPVDWSVIPLGKIAFLEYGASLPEKARIEGSIPVYGSNGVVGYHNEKLVSGPGIIIGRKGTVGAVTWAENDFWAIDTTYFISKEQCKEILNLRWFFYLLSNLHLEKLNAATGVPGINRGEVHSLIMRRPPIEEQKKIAEILTTVDDVIEETDTVIEKTKELKKGLMQQLLTRGIGHKKFKKTEIGEIPEEWKVVRLEELGAKEKFAIVDGPFGSSVNTSIDYISQGIPVIRTVNIRPFEFIEDNLKYISEEKFQELKRSQVSPGDVLLSKVGTVGYACILPSHIKKAVLSTTGSCKITVDKTRITPEYLCYYLNYLKPHMDKIAAEGVQPFLNMTDIKSFKIALPPLKEQKNIAENLSVINLELRNQNKNKENLETLKKSLMQVLLTGKVRVKLSQ